MTHKHWQPPRPRDGGPDRPDVISRLFTIVDTQRWDDLGDVFSPTAIYHRPGYPTLVGIEQIVRFYQETRVVASGRHTICDRLLVAEQGFCWGRFAGLSRQGQPLQAEFADWYELDSDRIIHRRTYFYHPLL